MRLRCFACLALVCFARARNRALRLRTQSIVSVLLGAVCALATSSLLLSCGDWVPTAGPVKPQLLIEGATRVETTLDESERYLLVSRFESDDEGNEQRRYNIVDWKKRTRCELPENVARFESSLFGATGTRKQKPLFLLPVVLQQEGDGEMAGPQTLAFYDELCQLQGETDYGSVSTSIATLTLDDDGREVMLYGNGHGVLALADPWHDERTQITTGFRAFSFVYRAGAFSAPQLLWIIEDGKLTQRTLDGTLLLSFGTNVTAFSQVLLSQLRVAYVDEGNVYEAVGPLFDPTRIATGACSPAYRGSSLELHNPCADSQLVRINLMTGETTEFEPGVFEAYTDSGYSFETARDAEGLNHQYVERPGAERVEIEPPFLDHPFVVDNMRLAGLKVLDPDPAATRRTLVLWSNGVNIDVFAGDEGSVDTFFATTDYRTSSYWWLVFHNRRDTPDVQGHALGTLSIVSAADLSIVQVADNVPTLSPVPRAYSMRGFSIELLPTFSKERAIAYIDDAVPLERDPRGSRGTLHVRLFSGELGAKIADDVSSYRLITSPLPGVLYGVEEGEQQGLWFAAL
jgi:hypothetical protein